MHPPHAGLCPAAGGSGKPLPDKAADPGQRSPDASEARRWRETPCSCFCSCSCACPCSSSKRSAFGVQEIAGTSVAWPRPSPRSPSPGRSRCPPDTRRRPPPRRHPAGAGLRRRRAAPARPGGPSCTGCGRRRRPAGGSARGSPASGPRRGRRPGRSARGGRGRGRRLRARALSTATFPSPERRGGLLQEPGLLARRLQQRERQSGRAMASGMPGRPPAAAHVDDRGRQLPRVGARLGSPGSAVSASTTRRIHAASWSRTAVEVHPLVHLQQRWRYASRTSSDAAPGRAPGGPGRRGPRRGSASADGTRGRRTARAGGSPAVLLWVCRSPGGAPDTSGCPTNRPSPSLRGPPTPPGPRRSA